MTLRHSRATRATRATSATWRRALAIGVLALFVSVAPRAADVCQAACAHASSELSAAPEHCARHAGTRMSSHDVAAAHDCQPHAHLLDAVAAALSFTQTASSAASAAKRLFATPVALPAALLSSLSVSPPALSQLPVERFASSLSSSRPLTVSLRI